MSSSKEKAKELFDYHYYCLVQSNITKRGYWAKQCALITVDQILKSVPKQPSISITMPHFEAAVFWDEVKTELESYEDSH
jgi:hypothetical protein